MGCKMDKMNATALMFNEWWLLHDNIVSLERFVRSEFRSLGKNRVDCYAVGSPRNCRVVINVRFSTHYCQKIIHVDIRDGSWQTWVDKMNAKEWTAQKV